MVAFFGDEIIGDPRGFRVHLPGVQLYKQLIKLSMQKILNFSDDFPSSKLITGAIDWKGKIAGPTSGQTTTLSFPATDDATIKYDYPTTTFAVDEDLIADNDPRQDFLLKFVVSGIGSRSVTSAALVLTATDPGPAGAQLYLAQHNNWNQVWKGENKLTYQKSGVFDYIFFQNF